MVTAFALERSLAALNVVFIDIKRSFSVNGKNIHLPKTRFLLCADAGNLDK